jgi:hypothetical protein
MSTYTARDGGGIVHAVYDRDEVYTDHRGPEDVAVCKLEYAWFENRPDDLVTCLWCLATMYTSVWWNIHADPDETMDQRQRWQR